MKPLKENYKILVFFGICPPAKLINRRMKLLITVISILCPTIECIAFIASSIYVAKSLSIDLTSAICAFYQIAALIASFSALIMAYISRQDVKKMFDNFEGFYNASKQTCFSILNQSKLLSQLFIFFSFL